MEEFVVTSQITISHLLNLNLINTSIKDSLVEKIFLQQSMHNYWQKEVIKCNIHYTRMKNGRIYLLKTDDDFLKVMFSLVKGDLNENHLVFFLTYDKHL